LCPQKKRREVSLRVYAKLLSPESTVFSSKCTTNRLVAGLHPNLPNYGALGKGKEKMECKGEEKKRKEAEK